MFLSKLFTPFRWLAKFLGKGLQYYGNNSYKINLVIVPNFLFRIFGLLIVINTFTNIKQDTTSLTNIGFAILAGIASVCFSWIRSLDFKTEPKMIARISEAGENALHSAILFLLASGLKYSALHLENYFSTNVNAFLHSISTILNISCSFCFILIFNKVNEVLSDINKLIYERQHQGERN